MSERGHYAVLDWVSMDQCMLRTFDENVMPYPVHTSVKQLTEAKGSAPVAGDRFLVNGDTITCDRDSVVSITELEERIPVLADPERRVSRITVAMRTTLMEDTLDPEVTIERRSYMRGEDSWAICWSGFVYDHAGKWVHERHHNEKALLRQHYTFADAAARAWDAIEQARRTTAGPGGDAYMALVPRPRS